MDNQISTENMSTSAISAMANVKEVSTAPKNYLHIIILISMIIFVVFVVGLSVINFEGFVSKQNAKVTNSQDSHSQDVQTLTN